MRKIRWGMVGGGPNSIGRTHRFAAALDGRYDLLAGVFSRDGAKNARMGAELGIAPDRLYPDFATMADAESRRPDGLDAVTICTPNDTHAAASIAFMERGIAVLCDKPIANSVADAVAMRDVARRTGVLFGLTHNYSAYPMVREARRLVQEGRLGAIRVVQAEYAIGSRSRLVEATGDTRFAWRVDPAIGGPSTVLGDIGTHAHHLLRTITGLEVAQLSADLSSLVPGRTAQDNADINLRLTGGARGHFWASMVANGAGQALRLRVYGERAGLEWHQQTPDELRLLSEDEPISVLRRGDAWLGAEAKRATRTQRGQPEGYIGAFANIYNDFAEALHAGRERRPADPAATSFASATDGVIGMAFVEAAVESSARDGAWTAPQIPGEDDA